MPSTHNTLKSSTKTCLLFLVLFVSPYCALGQQALKSYYPGSKQLYSTENWDKKRTRAHISIYYPDGKSMADGYVIKDRRQEHYELPDSVFRVYDHDGKVMQHMEMTKDSTVVFTYDTVGFLRSKIYFNSKYASEQQYYTSGQVWSKSECTLPDSINYYTGYNYAAKRPLLPIGYGVSGNDGISPPGIYKIYYHPVSMYRPNCAVCGYTTWYPDGKPMIITTNERTTKEIVQRFDRSGNLDKDTFLRAYHPSGSLKSITYLTQQKEAIIHYEWHENGGVAKMNYQKYADILFDTTRTAVPLRNVLVPMYTQNATEVAIYPNGRLSRQNTLFITAVYDSTGDIREELFKDIYMENDSGSVYQLNTAGLLHTGRFKNGMRDGIWLAFYAHDTNKVCYKINYKNGLLDGDAVVYDSLGRIILSCSVKNGVYDGPFLKMKNGDTVETVSYSDGLRKGPWRSYFNGKIERTDSVNYTGNKPFAEMILSYHREPYYKETERIYNKSDAYTEIYYYPNGKKKSEVIVDGTARSSKVYDEKGNLK